MKVCLRLDGEARGRGGAFALGPSVALLEALERTGSLQGAADALRISYRSAWGRLAALEDALGEAVAVKTKGHGSTLTSAGTALLTLMRAARSRLEPALAAEESALSDGLRRLLAPAPARIRLAASHDPLLSEAVETLQTLDLTIAGSLDALARLRAGTVDAAGFHYGADGPPPPSLAGLLTDPVLAVLPLFRREQGLMCAPGNPLGLTGIADIAARRARYVNRQKGAGTRIWFERLCAESGIAPEAIVGHHTEEFTHQAVAALIVAGAADAGMGTRTVAERFALDYRPLGWETYFLAARTTLDPARLVPLRTLLNRRAAEISGYGSVMEAGSDVTPYTPSAQ